MKARRPNTRALIVSLLLDGKERSSREASRELGFGLDVANTTNLRAWQKGELFRSKNVIFNKIEVSHGRLGIRQNVGGYHLYTVPVTYSENESFVRNGVEYVAYSRDHLDHRAIRTKSKSSLPP
ncbi:MAG: hypothetical protein OK439_04655 [Thaumarchaeota archaeon]|nr:hypothetical protein [Nitrososphaerota archaeon]